MLITTALSFGGILLAGLVILATRPRRPIHLYACVAGLGCLTAFLIAIAFSKLYWGYWISRPSLTSQLKTLSEVTALMPIELSKAPMEPHFIARLNSPYGDLEDLEGSMRHIQEDPYYATAERILPHLKKRGLLPQQFVWNSGEVPDVYPLIQASGCLVEPEPGYSGELYRGLMLAGRDRSGGALLWIGAHGSQVSNDHYPEYEFLLRQTSPGPAWTLTHEQHFFTDCAGIEGFEWYRAFPILASLFMFLSLIGFHIIVWIRDRLKASHPVT